MKFAVLCIFWIASAAIASAQKAPSAPKSPTTGTSTSTNSNTNSVTNNTSSINPSLNPVSRPIYLSGKVVLQDGTPPPDLVKIERVCGGSARTQGYTDSKGRFQFQVDSIAASADPDAGDSRGMGSRSTSSLASRGMLAGCDLRAVLAGFFSGTITLTNRTEFDSSDVGIIVLRRASNVEGTTISMTSLNAPKDALKAYEKGRELLKKEKTDDAERSFQKAVDLYPHYAVAWYQLGLLQTHDHLDQAELSFAKAIDADPKFISPYLSLTLIFEQSQRWQKAAELSSTVVKLNGSDFPQAYFFLAVAQFNLRDEAGAEKSVRKALDLDSRHGYPQAERLLGIILTNHNDLTGAAEHFRKYLELAPNSNDSVKVRSQLAEIEKRSVAAK